MSKASRKFKVPDELANLYDFANTLDLRRFTHHGVQHPQSDELSNAAGLAAWLAERKLGSSGKITPAMFDTALQLRSSVRDYLQCEPDERLKNKALGRALDRMTQHFPLAVEVREGGMTLRPARDDALAGLSAVVVEMYNAAANGTLARLKMCASDECHRVFYDRSKPATRRWCVSTLCGNRMKTRTYRERHQGVV
ncbi:MAG: CGNR zinc finger domain-containing protein [Afipia sp.]|nr:CGNR zinc finger domain-containing protein [Afipia sp.]